MRKSWIATVAGGVVVGALAVAVATVGDNSTDHQPAPATASGEQTAATAAPTTATSVPTTDTTAPRRIVTVSGEGTVKVKPDTATVYFGVSVTAKTATDALGQAGAKADTLIKVIQASGVADADIKTTGLSLYPQYDNFGKTITGYNVSNSVTVTIRQVDTTGAVIDAAAGFVGNEITIGGINFSVENKDAALAQSRKAAIADAKLRAEQYTAAAQTSVGQVLSISELSAPVYQPYAADASAKSAAAAGSTPIQTGTQDLIVNVTVTFELK